MEKFSYGISKDYLENWGLKEALREIYQNFLDFGEYSETVKKIRIGEKDMLNVVLSNDYEPENLEYLRIGNSIKTKKESIGKHGEGLKMALLVFTREDLYIDISSKKHTINPYFDNGIIGEVLSLYIRGGSHGSGFAISFNIPKDIFYDFVNGIIKDETSNVFTSPTYGSIVDKKKGDIFIGGLFVCNIKNFSRSYNFLPSVVPLDRDRAMPREFDVNWAASMINNQYEHWNSVDINYDDTKYSSNIPEKIKREYKPTIVGNSIEFTKEVEGKTEILRNEKAKEIFKKDSLFKQAISFIKKKLLQGLGVYDLLIKFKETHSLSEEALEDLDYIINKVQSNEQ